ncbi:MAG: hypothetical protein K2W95_15170 [Candidatus Obscuribacterales bacterium]|nr:hypothetical protein [Candidatus Obscuribacterales bacterium]
MVTANLEAGRIDYGLIGAAVSFYAARGYAYVEVPWFVTAPAFDVTCPPGVRTFDTYAGRLVASGEQSFLQMLADGKLPPGRYMCVTPCFRDEPQYDDLRKMYFLKVELIDTAQLNHEALLADALAFFSQYVPCRAEDMGDSTKDIVTVNGCVELGSYGTRNHALTGAWSYGTGCAEPRLSAAIKREVKS